jgi:hypothetical protein
MRSQTQSISNYFQYKFLNALFWEPITKTTCPTVLDTVQIFAVQKSRYFIVKFMQRVAILYPSLGTPTPILPLDSWLPYLSTYSHLYLGMYVGHAGSTQ